MSNIASALSHGKKVLKESGIETYALDAAVLLAAACGRDRAWLLANGDYALSETQAEIYGRYLARRAAHMPAAYIVNRQEFMSLGFYVDEHVLIPRPETEMLAAYAIDWIRRGCPKARVLDLCTGSGCVAVAVAHSCADVYVTATDISGAALDIARRNARARGAASRVVFLQGDMFNPLADPCRETLFDIILANPPYIRTAEMSALPACVKDYEPSSALDGGADGLGFYRVIGEKAGKYLRPGGVLAMETGHGQGQAVTHILERNGFNRIKILRDLAGLDRVVVAKGEGKCLTDWKH